MRISLWISENKVSLEGTHNTEPNMNPILSTQFTYVAKTNTFCIEASLITRLVKIAPREGILIKSAATGAIKTFIFKSTIMDKEELFGWEFRTSCGIKLIIFND